MGGGLNKISYTKRRTKPTWLCMSFSELKLTQSLVDEHSVFAGAYGVGGGGQGGHDLPLQVRFCPFVSRLPPFIVFLPLSCKSHCLTPYSDSNRECFGLVQNKKMHRKSNHSALSSAIIEAAFLRHKFTPRGKIFITVFCELPGRSSMDGFFPTKPKNTKTDQNGL